MPRFSPRVKVAIPVAVEAERMESRMIITDLGMNGAFLKEDGAGAGEELRVNARVALRYSVSRNEAFGLEGSVVRADDGGYAVCFGDLGREEERRLWRLVSRYLSGVEGCPFCGEGIARGSNSCQQCGWQLAFHAPGYFDYYERTSLLKKITSSIALLKAEELRKVAGYLEKSAGPGAEAEDEEESEFVGSCRAMLEVFSLIRKVAPTDISVLILGESGTGKEMTAQAIHERSMRKDRPFVAINCGAIPDTLLESELFGYQKGAFTGAYASKAGKFEAADGGTIFLDEIGEMPLALQVKLLRFLQDKNVERVGSVAAKKVDVRVLAATNCDLGACITDGRFRKDLFYRLNEFTITLPAIRERESDKLILAKYFLNKYCKEKGVVKTFSSEAADAIMAYEWPGNVREIINKVRRALVMGGGKTILPEDLELGRCRGGKTAGTLNEAVTQVERNRIREVLLSCNNNISTAAASLGITRQTLHRRIKMLGIKKGI